mgnify:CR=1 FL=1
MSLVDLVMPKLGESIMEATILKWHKSLGDAVAQDETLLDIATDKVDSEVPSTAEGTLAEILFKENDVVPIGAVIARIKTGAAEGTARAERMRRLRFAASLQSAIDMEFGDNERKLVADDFPEGTWI